MAFTTLLSPADAAAGVGRADWVFVDCRFALADPEAGRNRYAQGHIPGAVYAHLDDDLSSPIAETSGRHPLPTPEELAAKLGNWGIGQGVQVVAYDDAGGAFAARLWWLLKWLGHELAAVLDGGYPAWQAASLPTSTEPARPAPAMFAAQPDNALWLDAAAVQKAVDSGGAALLDARGAARYRGDEEPVDPVAGHVPGAINTPFAENLTADGAMRPAEELHARFAPIAAGTGEGGVVHMCGSGVTACHNALAMAAVGLPMGRLYAGSWSEWIRDPDRPVAKGS
ncbi:3-mercaptopyruvate sulfurtransferase [Posidoniimonas polymericola]|uniref:3-mercaptopyruvate sulfurtransferase n=1 Tax=Posidoniimonas polymericola TaxID=2528002 RepID=A0A5C5YPR6_9BACT|nr:sulfurtransferase [Posidoniimonas polymericola]TWT76819.1 3-mercaptopyruvate sulfurtransferase [Posidoniimonas polymericola]